MHESSLRPISNQVKSYADYVSRLVRENHQPKTPLRGSSSASCLTSASLQGMQGVKASPGLNVAQKNNKIARNQARGSTTRALLCDSKRTHARQQHQQNQTLTHSFPRPRLRKPPPPSILELSGAKNPDVTSVLARLEQYMTDRQLRPIDLFRSRTTNSSISAEKNKDCAGFSRGSWLGAGNQAGDDLIDADEFKQMLLKLDLRLSVAETKGIISALDQDGNGQIDLKELTEALRQARRAASVAKRTDRAASLAASVRRGENPQALYTTDMLFKRKKISPVPRWGSKIDDRPRFGCGHASARKDPLYTPIISDAIRDLLMDVGGSSSGNTTVAGRKGPEFLTEMPSTVKDVLLRIARFQTSHRMSTISMFRSRAINKSYDGDRSPQQDTKAKSVSRGSWMKSNDLYNDRGDDLISPAEMRGFLSGVGMNLSLQACADVVRYLDVDGNMQVDIQELDQALRAVRRKVAASKTKTPLYGNTL